MSKTEARIGGHAVVLGASMAGLLAARTLADFFDRVTVVDRDPMPDNDAVRRGVPQSRHLRALLARGAQVIEELFPGVLDELVLDGAQYFDGRDLSQFYYNVGGHLMARGGSANSFTAYCATRPFLEGHVRGRVRDIANVALLDEHNIVALTSTPDHRRVTGARVAQPPHRRRRHTERRFGRRRHRARRPHPDVARRPGLRPPDRGSGRGACDLREPTAAHQD